MTTPLWLIFFFGACIGTLLSAICWIVFMMYIANKSGKAGADR